MVGFGRDGVHIVGIPHYNVRIRPHHDGSLEQGKTLVISQPTTQRGCTLRPSEDIY